MQMHYAAHDKQLFADGQARPSGAVVNRPVIDSPPYMAA